MNQSGSQSFIQLSVSQSVSQRDIRSICLSIPLSVHLYICQSVRQSNSPTGVGVLIFFSDAVIGWIKSHLAVLWWSQTLQCAMFLILTLCSIIEIICSTVVSCLTFFSQSVSQKMLTGLRGREIWNVGEEEKNEPNFEWGCTVCLWNSVGEQTYFLF